MRKFLIALGLGLALLLAVIFVRAVSYGGPGAAGERVDLPEPPNVDARLAAQHLSEAIQMKTVTYQAGDPLPGAEGPWLDLHAWLERTYPAAHQVMTREIIPGGYTLLYTWTGTDPSLKPTLMMAHQDVVPVSPGTESKWTGAPFSGDIIDEFVYGRGAIDDKASLVALMEAAEALAKTGYTPRRTIHYMFGHDEEVSGSGAKAGVALLKSRGVEPEVAIDEGFLIIDNSPLTGKRMGFIGTAEKGYMSVQIVATGIGGHSSTPPRDSATVRLGRALVALDENQMPSHISEPPTSDLFKAAGPDMRFTQKLVMANLWLFGGSVDKQLGGEQSANAMVRTTTAPTMLIASPKENVLAQRAVATVNFRIHPLDTPADVLAHIENVTAHIPGLEIEQASEGNGATPISPTDNRAYAVLASVADKIGEGAPVAPAVVLGATDARYAVDITDNVYRFMPAILSPEDLTGFHGTNERMSVENMGNLSRGYAMILMAMDTE